MKQINVQNVLLIVIAGLLFWQLFSKPAPIQKTDPVQVVIPPVEGSSGLKIIEVAKPVPIVTPGGEKIIVDEKYKKMYEESQDSIERLNLYLSAIQIKEYKDTVVNDSNLIVVGNIKTRGSLLSYKFDYNILEKKFEYVPEVVVRRPGLSLSVGASAGVPTDPNSGFLMKGEFGLENRKGEAVTIGYDTGNHVWLGLRKSFKILK